ncbi:hypothetical protein PISL3812_05912 [Talaromyces islandicus]|uniref:Uncharacterized protein n=1 Tax=Talaromyces islandicus TaxID=28573 RepID=A0A0U1LZZ5_TALIS|nr:hypothetical protein PISL3812_05912 [Talaromyces islandicus]
MPTTSTASDATTAATAVGALTTKFNPAPSCLMDLYLEVTSLPSEPSIPGGYSWIHLGPTTSKAACVPSGWAPEAYYSPGICPASYTLGCDASTHTIGKSTTEYRATCCPTGYECRASEDTSLYPWATIDPCTVRGADLTWTTAIVTYNTNTPPPATLDISVTNYYQALGVSIRWQESDSLPVQTGPPTSTITTTAASSTSTAKITTKTSLPISTSMSTTSHSTSTTVSSSPSTGAPSASTETHSSAPVSEKSSSSGLSTGAKAGVGVGVSIAGILIIFAAVFFFYIRPRRNKSVPQGLWNGEKKTELDATVAASVHTSHELASSAVNELEGSNRHIVHEMDSTNSGWKR